MYRLAKAVEQMLRYTQPQGWVSRHLRLNSPPLFDLESLTPLCGDLVVALDAGATRQNMLLFLHCPIGKLAKRLGHNARLDA
jgi:hypothetical protein